MHSQNGGRTVRVLIADDNPVVRKVFEALVKREQGFELVGAVADGDECLRAIQDHKPDVLSLDLEMPRMSGRTVLMRLVENNLRPGVVVVTGLPIWDQPSLTDELRSLGAHAILYKDFAPSGNDLNLFTRDYFTALRNAANGAH
ncbi:MAG: response regulator [bacterium]|nr:response regulator [bacterium]